MADLGTPAIRSAGTQTPKNYYRFYPGRKPRTLPDGRVDNRILFESAVYARIEDEARSMEAGIVVGPTLATTLSGTGQEKLQIGSGLVAAKAIRDENTGAISIPHVRKWPVPNTQTLKTFIDLLTLRRMPDGSFNAVPLEEDNVVYFECCTGDPQESEDTYIAALSGLWLHGSAEYMGFGSAPIVSAPSKKRGKLKDDAGGSSSTGVVKVSETNAPQLWGEASGAIVNGVPLWWTRVWRINYTRDESEVVIVRQENRYYKLYVDNGRGKYHDCSGQPGIEQEYMDNIAKLASLGVSTTPLIIPPSGIIRTEETVGAGA